MTGPTLDRRRLLALAGASSLAAGGCQPAHSVENNAPQVSTDLSLGDLAAARGRIFGSAFELPDVLRDEAYGALIKRHARILTTENCMKFDWLRPNGPEVDFVEADATVAFAAQAGIPLRGHTLIWNDWPSKWLLKETAQKRAYWLDRHIDEVCGRYAGRLHSWDVVNEPLWPQHGNPGGLRSGPWYDALGRDYIKRSFLRAEAADPAALLVLNEAGPEWAGAASDKYRASILDIVREVKDAGGRVDVVGLECHYRVKHTFDPAVFNDFVGQLGEIGTRVYVTELDVSDAGMPGDRDARDRQVADVYRQIVTTALGNDNVPTVITWGLSDAHSWLSEGPGDFLQPRGRPLPFDENCAPKPAFFALADALALT